MSRENNFFNIRIVQVLKDVSFSVSRGESVAIVGGSGSGKTTCLSLIHRFYEPQEGTIRFYGIDIAELNESSLRRQVGYVQQCPVLFGATIEEGITCHSSHKSPMYLETLSRVVGIHSFVMEFPEKYNYPLTRDLSVEQRQRIALARVLYRKPHVLLMDNALSSLSPEAEANVYDSIRRTWPNLTIIIVTDNSRILRKVAKILYAENDSIDEFTSVDSLIDARFASRKILSDRSDLAQDTDGFHGSQRCYESLWLSDGERLSRIDVAPTSSSSGLRAPALKLSWLEFFMYFYVETTLKCEYAASTSRIILSKSSSFAGRSYQEFLRSELVRIGRYPVFFRVTDIATTENILPTDIALTKMNILLSYNLAEFLELLFACVAAAILGFSLPVYTVLFGETLSLVALHNGLELQIRLNFFTNMFFVAGFVSGISTIIQGYMLSVSGSRLTTRMRKRALKKILQQNLEWFDCETNDESGINGLLKTSSPRLQQACGQRLVFMVQAVTSLAVSIVLSLSYSWKMGSTTFVFTPVSLLLLRYNGKLHLRKHIHAAVYLNRAKEIIVETVTNAKSIVALTLEEAFLQRYRDELRKLALQKGNGGLHALIHGACVALPAIAYAVSMFYGGYMLKTQQIEISKVFKVAEAIILGTLMVGHLVSFAPNIAKAQIAAAKLIRIIESPTPTQVNGDKKKLAGRVTFEDVSFQHSRYAGLPKLRGFSMDVRAGESVALVGNPRSGASIPIELILGFYGITSGKIAFDGEHQTRLDTKNLRTQIGLVEGDPIFFQRTIADNISYGDLCREIRMDEIVRVTRLAGLHDFVVALPRGYRTVLDDRVELTVSQKIRLSLARALTRKPKILLFSNLKRGESEEAEFILRTVIEAASRDRTCIASSHDPFSAVQLFPRLLVIDKGIVGETGTHEELSNANGLYAKLCVNSHN